MAWSQSDSDNDLFLTQNVYRSQDSNEYNTDDAVADALDLQHLTYQPIVPDVPDDELLAVIQTDHFEIPKGDYVMARMSTRR